MWGWRKAFTEFVTENRLQHRQVHDSIKEVHERVDQVHGRVNSTRKMMYGFIISALVGLVAALLTVAGWALSKLIT